MKCSKCGYVRLVTDVAPEWQCPSCQVAYVKARASTGESAAAGSTPSSSRVPKLAPASVGTDDPDELAALAASGQKIVIYSILLNFVVRGMLQANVVAPLVAMVMAFGVAAYSLVGVLRILLGAQEKPESALAYIGPEDAARFRAVLTTERATSATLPEARLQTRSMLMALGTARLGFADQETKIAWGQMTVDTLRELTARSPEECYAALSGQALDRETLAHGFSAQNSAAFEAAVLQVLLESPGIGPSPVRRGADRRADFNATMREYAGIQDEVAHIFSPEVSALLTNKRFPQSPPMSADTVCAARIYQLEAMLKRPQATAALLVDSALR